MSIMSNAYMKMFPMEAEKKMPSGKRNAALEVPEFNKAWNLYRDTSLDIMKRYEYMAQCVDFTDKDTEAIKESKDIIAANLKAILDHIYYEKLINDPWLSRWFRDDNGKIAKEYVDIRRARQQRFLLKVLECKWDEEFWNFVRWVGAVHVPIFGFEDLYIPVRLNLALWGYIHQYLFNLFARELKNDPEKLRRITTAWTKLFWIIIDIYHIDYFGIWM
ncbi:Protoglobin [Candidatus Brocadiaceae bacterium B188]|nr:protoglobin family protein [Candidatus Brocadia sapporoensis]MEB2308768.1 protoglobin family protein [Candidatus Brocadiaceae bacterium]TWU50397.1 Protoglobin [Candidatus Brocadiaceae bacterium B188]